MAIKLLTYTTLYPDSTRPSHGIFVETRLRHLLASGQVESRVVAPVPWFPFTSIFFKDYARFARVPGRETWHGIDVAHPRYPLIPKIGMTLAPYLLAAATGPFVRRVIDRGYDFDVLDAHYFYPDGVAAAMIARSLKKPLVITARGSDINLIPQYYLPRRMIHSAAGKAGALIAVSHALKGSMIALGIPGSRITVLRNGVDLQLFRPPQDRQALRKKVQFSRNTLLFVGNLVPEKGIDLCVRALALLPENDLIIIGSGPRRKPLEELASDLHLSSRVKFLGPLNQEQLPDYYGAADALLLASSREGWPNVVLESLACGTPVVATPVGGNPEIIAAYEAGVVIRAASPRMLADGISRLLSQPPDRSATRRYAEQFSWDATTEGQIRVFRELLDLQLFNH